MGWALPTIADVLEANRRIAPYLRPTPLYRYAGLDALLGTEVFVKHENHQPVGAFKVRGGVNLISQLDNDERTRGVISASTGNHGQSIAYAAALFDVPATICVPENANPVKVGSMRGLGANVIFHGRDFDDAREHCERLAQEHGYRYIHSGNEPLLIAGVGTETLEILEEQPRVDTIVVPVGGGSGAAGACIVAKSLDPAIKVIGVQSEAAPAAYRSWQARELVDETRMETFAEGLVKFRVGRYVWHSFSRDETTMGFAFPKEWRQAIVDSEPDKFFMPSTSDLRYTWACVRMAELGPDEMRELVLDAWAMVVPERVARGYAERG